MSEGGPTLEELQAWLRGAGQMSLYAMLRLDPKAHPSVVKIAFHQFALRYHPDRFVGKPKELGALAASVFKRGVEAYRILSRAHERAQYDEMLVQGSLRYDPRVLTIPKASPKVVTLEDLARTAKGKKLALAADRLLSIGHLEEARLKLVESLQVEPDNDPLKERLRWIYEAMALEGDVL